MIHRALPTRYYKLTRTTSCSIVFAIWWAYQSHVACTDMIACAFSWHSNVTDVNACVCHLQQARDGCYQFNAFRISKDWRQLTLGQSWSSETCLHASARSTAHILHGSVPDNTADYTSLASSVAICSTSAVSRLAFPCWHFLLLTVA